MDYVTTLRTVLEKKAEIAMLLVEAGFFPLAHAEVLSTLDSAVLFCMRGHITQASCDQLTVEIERKATEVTGIK